MALPNFKRQSNYKKLRDAGFTSRESTRFKDHNDWVVDNLILAKHYFKEHVNVIVKERGKQHE